MKENTLNNEIQIAVFEEKIERANRWIDLARSNNEPKEFILQLEDIIVAFMERINELKNQ